jgi:hypothetical protein
VRREQVQHVARTAGQVAGVKRVLVVDSQAVLGTYDEFELPERAIRSLEADIVVLDDDDQGTLSNLVDGSIGFGSEFHSTFHVYADGVDLTTSRLPEGWEGRVKAERIPASDDGEPIAVHYLEAHDLCIAKLAAGRTQDVEFVDALAEADLVDPTILAERASLLLDAEPAIIAAVRARLEKIASRKA